MNFAVLKSLQGGDARVERLEEGLGWRGFQGFVAKSLRCSDFATLVDDFWINTFKINKLHAE
jgi:hypothetical protein